MTPGQTTKAPQRGRDICHLAFRQTLDLLAVADQALEELCSECPSLPEEDALVLRAMNEMALGERGTSTRAPSHVALFHGPAPDVVGALYALGPDGYAPAGAPLRATAEEFASLVGTGTALVLSNLEPGREGERGLPPGLGEALGAPLRNVVAYRIVGDRPGALVAFNYPQRATRYEAQVLSALAVTLGSVWTLASKIGQVEEAFLYLVGALARASEVNDEVTGDHVLRVSRHTEVLARAAGYPAREAHVLAYSAQLHDVGKIHTPREILRKQGPLIPGEVAVMREHTLQGEKIIGSSPRLALARRIAGGHHENWDGSGYPRGLAGETIPREARLVKIVDIYEALRSERPYKGAYTHEEACRVLRDGDARTDPGRHFDPDLLRVFHRVQAEFQRTHAEIQPWG